MRIRYSRDEPHFPVEIELLSGQIKFDTLFKNFNEIIRRRCDKIIHKAMRIPVDIYQRNKRFFFGFNQKNACKLEFVDHLCLPFLDKPYYDIVVFSIITFHAYNILVNNGNM